MEFRLSALLALFIVLLAPVSHGAPITNFNLDSGSNLYYYGSNDWGGPRNDEYHLSTRNSYGVDPFGISDFMDGVGTSPYLLKVEAGSFLDIDIGGTIRKVFTGFDSFFNANGQNVLADGAAHQWTMGVGDVPVDAGAGLPILSVVGAWVSAVSAVDNSFKALLSGAHRDFVVGTSFEQIVPDGATYLALGILDSGPNDTSGSFAVSGSLTAVPVPAAFWYLFSFILSYFGYRRMRA